ncbi:YgiQ family radical SAM protein [Granulosicoccus antarcticus]|uniref:Ribosomal protein S12 methylthiotransferase RimO n=1 Tax=Granulosicoccus antarcticus IMCC3135 TaxID=1192854 RepID=A0A2Z2NSS3_9GAMM|nr:YgiQ family radical SAM protein [Granulosicoccus antarcticus]ASJ74349.1 Ribosomal protein S12 methylthiotransferase RimO [Granulosicoccus antarcticus IMCC3135]
MSARPAKDQTRALFDYPPYWAECYGRAPFLPMNRAEMDELGWDSCDIIVVTGDAYVDHPSFGMAIIGRLLESHGFRVGIIAQPDWQNADAFKQLGAPNLFFGVTSGNMDSMINRYTADRKIRSDDAYTPDDIGGKRPDRSTIVYSHRCREAYQDVPIVIGGIEASLRRIAHYDYWQDKVRHSILADAKADMLVYGNGERAIVDIAHRLAAGNPIDEITDLRGTAFIVDDLPSDWIIIDSSKIDKPGRIEEPVNPYVVPQDGAAEAAGSPCQDGSGQTSEQSPAISADTSPALADLPALEMAVGSTTQVLTFMSREERQAIRQQKRNMTVLRLPSYDMVKNDKVLYAHANRVLHLETNPGNARAMVQNQGGQKLWLNPPPIPLTTEEMDYVFDQPYKRVPHPLYGKARIPAYEMIRFSINIMRGCFGGCTFCSITEHEGRVIQNRSEDSIIKEIEIIRDEVPGFTGVISDLGGPTANMYRIACKSREIEANCRLPSCVYPDICSNLDTDHSSLIKLYKRARELPGVKKVLIASGLRYDLAIKSPEYVEELVTHHVGGYLKIAPEHTERGPLDKMMKPGIGAYDQFKEMFEHFTKKAGKKQFLIPYFIAAHPGTTDSDMMNLAIWLKTNGFRADQVQNFYPSPMATATTMYHTGKNPLKRIRRDGEEVPIPKSGTQRKLHKAFLRYHDPQNWPMLRDALRSMGRNDLIGNGKQHLIPTYQPKGDQVGYQNARRKNSTPLDRKSGRGAAGVGKVIKGQILSQHTGLPPRETN